MASKLASTTALILCLNLVFFALVSANSCAPSTPKPAPVKPKPSPVKPKPSPAKPSPAGSKGSCPINTLKLGACADLLKGVPIHVVLGTPPVTPCCTLIKDLANAEAALCLCTAIKANILGINVNTKVSVTALLNYCGKKEPKGFLCA